MKALVVTGPGAISLTEVPAPTRTTGSALVAPRAVGVCGTDLEIIDGRIDPDYVRLPLILGHEWAGVVVEADDLDEGERVVVEGIVPCGLCAACGAGDTNVCEVYDEFGFVRDGAAAELIVVPTSLVHRLNPSVSDESAALIEPAAVVLRALMRAAPTPGQRVLVIGDGSVGLIAAALIRLWSPASVTLAGLRAEQAGLTEAAGVDHFLTAPSEETYDLVIKAAGAPAAVNTALSSAKRGATVVLLGLAGADATLPVAFDELVNADLTVIASFSYTRTAWRRVVDLMNSGRLDLGFLVTHQFPLEQWKQAIDVLRNGDGSPRGKVLLRPS